MADAPEHDELLLDNEAEDQSEAEEQEQGSEQSGDEGGDELEIDFGGEAAPASGERDTALVRHLREQIKERDKRLAEVGRQSAPQTIEVGERPTLAGCEYDEDRYETEAEAWRTRKAQAEQAQAGQADQQRQANEAWQQDLQRFETQKLSLKLKMPDAEEAVETAVSALDQVQQAVVVTVAGDSALVLAALGKHPAKLAELSQIKNPLKLAAAVAKLEGTLTVKKRAKAPDPEEIAQGNKGVTMGTDKKLERLEKEADKTGDRTELVAYRASQRRAAK